MMTGREMLAVLAVVVLGVGLTASAARAQCATCGNNIVQAGEQCDGTNPGICPPSAGCFPPGAGPNKCQCMPASCAAIDANSGGANASGTFTTTSAGAPQNGALYCAGISAANAFGPCVTDVQCGGTAGACQPIPWLEVGVLAPFPTPAVTLKFTAAAPDAKCVHTTSVPCGPPSVGACPTTPGLPATDTCCTTPGLTTGTMFIAALGVCSRSDQTACGGGVIDTSVPMLGDNDVSKVGDTTTPSGPTCSYVGTDVHPACAAVEDALGQIKTTIGNGAFDAAGGHSRITIPLRSVAWFEISAPPCVATSTYDGAPDLLISKSNLKLAGTTASATAMFMDSASDGDAIAFCSSGPGGPAMFNASATGAPDLPGAGARTVSVGVGLTGGGPSYDLLFAAVTPFTSPVLVAPVAACTPPAAGCPE